MNWMNQPRPCKEASIIHKLLCSVLNSDRSCVCHLLITIKDDLIPNTSCWTQLYMWSRHREKNCMRSASDEVFSWSDQFHPDLPALRTPWSLAVNTLTSDTFAEGELRASDCQKKLARLPDSSTPQGHQLSHYSLCCTLGVPGWGPSASERVRLNVRWMS